MKNTEIRIGNYVYRNDILVTVDEQTFWDMKNNPEQYKPVPITEDWLEKLGFAVHWRKKQGVLQTYFKNGNRFHVTNSGNIVYGFKSKMLFGVHELQNLYFALTNQELKA